MIERLVRFAGPEDGLARLGRIEGGEVVQLSGDLFGERIGLSGRVPLEGLRLLAPCVPSKVIGIGSNYRRHAAEMGKPIPAVPKIFLIPSTAVVGPGDPIVLPPGTERVDHEAELALVIGRRCSRVRIDEALDHVLGYTCANDVTARDFQKADGTFSRAKGFDTFMPLGPCIVRGLDPAALRVQGRVNGELRQDGCTDDMIFDVATLVSFVSQVMTLLPGDVISTGTPMGVGPVFDGDVVDIEIPGIGVLSNPVRNRDDRG